MSLNAAFERKVMDLGTGDASISGTDGGRPFMGSTEDE
jgi:hypothetical protein